MTSPREERMLLALPVSQRDTKFLGHSIPSLLRMLSLMLSHVHYFKGDSQRSPAAIYHYTEAVSDADSDSAHRKFSTGPRSAQAAVGKSCRMPSSPPRRLAPSARLKPRSPAIHSPGNPERERAESGDNGSCLSCLTEARLRALGSFLHRGYSLLTSCTPLSLTRPPLMDDQYADELAGARGKSRLLASPQHSAGPSRSERSP